MQVGDPFKEKLLLEACLELLAHRCRRRHSGHGRGRPDLLDLRDREPRRNRRGNRSRESAETRTGHDAVRNSAQRIAGADADHRQAAARKMSLGEIFEKWDVPCAEIGRVTDDGMMRVLNNGSVAAEIPAKPLADEAPLYSREAKAPRTPGTRRGFLQTVHSSILRDDRSASRSLRQLLRDPTIASKNWVYRQYDHMVRTGTVV